MGSSLRTPRKRRAVHQKKTKETFIATAGTCPDSVSNPPKVLVGKGVARPAIALGNTASVK